MRSLAVARATLTSGLLLAAVPAAYALSPALDVSQYIHRTWKFEEGFSKGAIYSIAQTPDGYLWLGTEFGLLRFDGVRLVAWEPPPGQPLPSNVISHLLATRDGSLWIGTQKGLVRWKGGSLTQYPEFADRQISALLEDRENVVWVGEYSSAMARLCSIRTGTVTQCDGEGGRFGRGVAGLYEDGHGRLWVGLMSGLWQWRPGPPQFYALPDEINGMTGLAEDDDGALLISRRRGLSRFVDGKETLAYPSPVATQPQAQRLLRDRDGGLWVGTIGAGLVHFHHGRADVFAQTDGLSSDQVQLVFEDREGNVWVATDNGLDHFREAVVRSVSTNQGLSNSRVTTVLAARDGGVWIGSYEGLNRWRDGRNIVYRERPPHGQTSHRSDGRVTEINGPGLPEHGVQSMFEDSRGRLWVATRRDVGYIERDRFTAISGVPAENTNAIAEDSQGAIWIANTTRGLFRVSPDKTVRRIAWSTLGHQDVAMTIAADRVRGGLWFGFYGGGIVYAGNDGQMRASYAVADGLGEGTVNTLHLDQAGTLWVSTPGGLSRVKDGRVATVTSRNGLPCDAVHWALDDDAGDFWLFMACGLARIDKPDLDAWFAAAERDPHATPAIRVTLFDASDGVRGRSSAGGYHPLVAKATDGTLWFVSRNGAAAIDPQRLPFNTLAPPVWVEQITADKTTDVVVPDAGTPVRLPPLVHDLRIDYTALSLVAPDKVRFRYKLEGQDRDWQEVGSRRQAFYNDLRPGTYRFRVTGANNSGVWNEAGTVVEFVVAPAYYQTTWFRATAALAGLALLAALYRLRLRQVKRQLDIRMEERIGERTRIARDLHDTLLQSFQGVLLKFHAVSYLIRERPDEATARLEAVIEQARGAIGEARDAVQGLRSGMRVTTDLGLAITAIGEELAADSPRQPAPQFRVQVEGTSRPLAPLLQDQVYRIAAEAVRNAFRHADARRIEVDVRYDEGQLCVRVRDDGKGVDPSLLAAASETGHFGLAGMQERAALIGGRLTVWSERDAGTEIELTIPAAAAYTKVPAAERAALARGGA